MRERQWKRPSSKPKAIGQAHDCEPEASRVDFACHVCIAARIASKSCVTAPSLLSEWACGVARFHTARKPKMAFTTAAGFTILGRLAPTFLLHRSEGGIPGTELTRDPEHSPTVGPFIFLADMVLTQKQSQESTKTAICVSSQCLCGLGGERGRNRTYNLLIKSQLLCQLSYAPFGGNGSARTNQNYSIRLWHVDAGDALPAHSYFTNASRKKMAPNLSPPPKLGRISGPESNELAERIAPSGGRTRSLWTVEKQRYGPVTQAFSGGCSIVQRRDRAQRSCTTGTRARIVACATLLASSLWVSCLTSAEVSPSCATLFGLELLPFSCAPELRSRRILHRRSRLRNRTRSHRHNPPPSRLRTHPRNNPRDAAACLAGSRPA